MGNEELIKITTNEQGVQCVSARELHEGLEVGRDFTTWVKGRINKYGFEENVDFTKVSLIPQNGGIKTGRGGDTKSVDYIITVDMAKELCMVENNELGRKFRKYFIECEKKLREITSNPTSILSTDDIGKIVEEKMSTYLETNLLQPLEDKVNRLEGLIGIRSKTVFDYTRYIKTKLGITRINEDYKSIKRILFYEYNIDKWEQLTYNDEVIDRIDELCEKYKPRKQRSLFNLFKKGED